MSRKDSGDTSRGGGSSRGAGGSTSQSDEPPVSRQEFLQLLRRLEICRGN